MNSRNITATTVGSAFVVLLGCSICIAQDTKKPARKKQPAGDHAMKAVTDDPSLPRVLLIGDSISIGYTVSVRKLLNGKANVHRPLTNCGPTTRGLANIDAWLGKQPWDVIHFNWGLHDLKYLGPKGQNLADPLADDSHQQVPPDEYEKNLRKLVQRMEQTKAKLIWCSTTPVPKGAKGRVVGDSVKYNEIAAKVMKDHGVAVNDLYGFAMVRLAKIQRPANVHFSPEGSKSLAEQVVKAIEGSGSLKPK